MKEETLSFKEKMILLVATIIICLGFGGCSCQIQVGGHGNAQSGAKAIKKDLSYHDRLVSGQVSIYESIQRARAKKERKQ